MSVFERYLTVWVAVCIIAGILLGNLFPQLFKIIADIQWAHVNIVIALCIWVMVYPMMIQVDFSSIRNVGIRPRGIVLTLIINWLVKPFTMAILGWLFLKILFVDLLDPTTASEYLAGMILLGVAPCTAMVFIWSQLTKGDANYTLVQVSLNDVIMIFAFAPIAGFLLSVADINIPWETLIFSVFLYVILPLAFGMATRFQLEKAPQKKSLDKLLNILKPFSIIGLLSTVTLLFGFQADIIIDKPHAIALIAIPLIIQTYSIFAVGYLVARAIKLSHDIAAPACLIGTSNFFELAVAVAISLFGMNSGAALATVVGVLVEVPIMLTLVYIVNRTRRFFPVPS